MIQAALGAVSALSAPALRWVLLKSLALTLALFGAILAGAYFAMSNLLHLQWGWLQTTLEILAGAGLVLAMVFLMAPVTAMFAGLFLDEVADAVEAADYPDHPKGEPMTVAQSIVVGVKFLVATLLVMLAVLPFILVGIGAIAWIAANSYLIGREYFTMVATRYVPAAEAERLRREQSLSITMAGLLPALLSLVPVLNLLTPVFSTAYFVHFVKASLGPRAR